ncbi:MAG: bifunctional folylpolyglutamate synthase/dihydrofolate synthase, partial [Saprospiraceae bacterium]
MQKLKTWKETLDFMYQRLPMYQRIGAAAYKKDLTNTILLCEACGNPHLQLKCIHIAGTNGKGTTTHIIASGL